MVLHVTPEIIAHVEAASWQFHIARMNALAQLDGNPFGVELRSFGSAVAVKVRHPLLAGKNRAVGYDFTARNELNDLLHFYRQDHLLFHLTIPHGKQTYALFRQLVEAGLWSAGSVTVPVLALDGGETILPLSPEIQIRQSGEEERELYLDLFQQAFGHRQERAPEYRQFQWAEDSLPGGLRYIAEIAGQPVGIASFPIVDRVGFFGTAGVLPEYRNRGVQRALIYQRIRDAIYFGCRLVVGGGSPGTTTYRNFARAGLRLLPSGSIWSEKPN